MNVYKKEIQQTKTKIKKYYENQRIILWHHHNLEKLHVRIQNIKDDMNNPEFQFSLKTDLTGIQYDGILVQGGNLPSSSMERDIEKIYIKLEKECLTTEKEILQTKMLIRQTEKGNESISYCIGLLGKEYRSILEKKFLERKNLIQISFDVNMSKSNVGRILYDIYFDMTRLLENIENAGKKLDKYGKKTGFFLDAFIVE